MSFNIRQTCLWIHRYTGLVMVAFLIIAGSTGALLAFYEELDDLFNYQLAYSDAQSNEPLSIAMLHDNVINTYPKYKFSSMPTSLEPDKSAVFSVDKVRDKAAKTQESTQEKAPFQEVYVNPYTGTIIGTRDREQWAWRNTMYKVFWLHRELLLGDIGKLILGIIALIWTINCFIGFYLTLPRKVATSKAKKINDTAHSIASKTTNKKWASFVKRWLPAWKIRTKTNTFKLNYDLHQAFGLWLWLMLFIIAWSSVGFNLQQVYQPVMQAVIGLESKQKQPDKPKKPAQIINKEDTTLSVTKADSIAYLTAQADIVATKNGVKVEQLLGIRWISEDNQWQMRFKTNKDIGKKGGASSITVDAITGNIEKVSFGYQSSAANKIDQWLATLHMGHISQGQDQQLQHLLYQLFLVVIGLAVATLSGTGAYLWLKGRKQRLKSAQKALNQRAKLSSKLEPYR